MAYLALYRLFRPNTLDEVVRQEHIIKILKNQITTGKIGHAYLFCGPRGTGKTSIARIFARAINCENPVDGSPCGKCPACKSLVGGSMDIVEIDAASNNGVNEMRDLREKVQYPPVNTKYKVYIVDEVHMLTEQAFNALLKTLEEPPKHAVFILATTESHKLPATILSRCMRFDFKLLPQEDLEGLLKNVFDKIGKQYEDEAVSAIARAGAGSCRDSLSIADMCVSYSTGKLTYDDVNAVLGSTDFYNIAKLSTAILEGDASLALSMTESILSQGKGVGVLVKDMLTYLNNVAIAKMCKDAKRILNLPEDMFREISDSAAITTPNSLMRATEIIAGVENSLKYSLIPRISLENAIVRAAMPATERDVDSLLSRIETLEKKLEEGVKVKISSIPQRAAQDNTSSAALSASQKTVGEEQTKTDKQREVQSFEDDFYSSPVMEEPIDDYTSFEEDYAPVPKTERAAKTAREQQSMTEVVEEQKKPVDKKLEKASSVVAASDVDETKLFASFVKSLRKTYKNPVLFTLCMDLTHRMENGKMYLSTDAEAVYKALMRSDNFETIKMIFAELGVADVEISLMSKDDARENERQQILENFKGINIQFK